MKFKIGDKVMLKAVPYDDFILVRSNSKKYYEENKEKILKITKMFSKDSCYLNNECIISFKYLKHAVKPKAVKYTIDCRRG